MAPFSATWLEGLRMALALLEQSQSDGPKIPILLPSNASPLADTDCDGGYLFGRVAGGAAHGAGAAGAARRQPGVA